MQLAGLGWTEHCEGKKTGYSHLAPSFTLNPRKINQPLGRKKADAIAEELGITKDMLLTRSEYRKFLGTPETRAQNSDQATIYDCVQFLTNSKANPYKVDLNGDGRIDERVILGSYGMSVVDVNSELYIQTDCYEEGGYQAQCLKFNKLAKGYLQKWSLENGTYKQWREMLKLSSFKKLTAASLQCQNEYVDSNACIVDLKGTQDSEQRYAGVPLAPTLWLINFMFIYKMNPNMAAKMPGYAALIPEDIAKDMIQAQADEQPGLYYEDYIDQFPGKTSVSSGGRKLSFSKNKGLVESAISTGDGNDKVTFAPDMVINDCAEFKLGKGNDQIIFNGINLKESFSVSLGSGSDEVTLSQIDANPNGRLIVNDFSPQDSLIVDGELLKGSDLLEGLIDGPDYLVINPENPQSC